MQTAIFETGLVMRTKRMSRQRTVRVLVLCALVVAIASLCLGSSPIRLSELFGETTDGRLARDVVLTLRLLFGNDQRALLPAAALGGGILLIFADLVSRALVAPQQLPVGVVTAAFGAPFFLILLNRGTRLAIHRAPSRSSGELLVFDTRIDSRPSCRP